jgi:hypothetical protein
MREQQIEFPRTTRPATGLRSIAEHFVKHFVALATIAIGLLLAADTKWSPWDRSEPLWADLLFAMDTDPKRTLFDPTKSRPHVSQQVRFAVEIAYREVALGRVLQKRNKPKTVSFMWSSN